MRTKNCACPLGAKCETLKEDAEGPYLEVCPWYTEIAGTNPQTGEQINKKQCAVAWMPLLSVQHAQATSGVNDAVCSLREETIIRQNIAIEAMSNVRNITSQ